MSGGFRNVLDTSVCAWWAPILRRVTSTRVEWDDSAAATCGLSCLVVGFHSRALGSWGRGLLAPVV